MYVKKIFALVLGAALLAGCGAGARSASAPTSAAASSSAAASAVSQAASAAAQPVTVQPLTGENRDGTAALERPVAVTISNAAGAQGRQWGLADAAVVMEALTEGRSTNLMLWYTGLSAVPKVGPAAQGKDIFWQFALPENSILVQRGMNLYAQNLLNCYAWQPIDALYVGVNCFDYDGSDPAAADEFCWFTQGPSLQTGLDHYGISAQGTVPQWLQFGAVPTAGGAAAAVTVAYSDQSSTTLRRENGAWAMYNTAGSPQTDANTGAQAVFANVLVLYASAGVKDDRYTRDYDLTGGSGLYFTGDTWQAITWKKGDAAAPLQLFGAAGAPLTAAAGKTYLGIYGGFAGQSVSVTAADGTAVDTGLAAPAAMATPAPTAAPTADPAAAPADAAPADPAAAPAA